jgi:hypothetical protein
MKKFLIISLILVTLLGLTGYGLYHFYFSYMVAEAITTESLPIYIPKGIQRKLDEMRKPVNKGAEEIVVKMHEGDIPVEKIIKAIDETTEEQAYAMLDELNKTPIKNANQVFDIGKKHFPVDFDAEILRKPFTDHIDMKLIRRAIRYGNINKRTKDIDIETAKAIAKKIFLEKEKKYNSVK